MTDNRPRFGWCGDLDLDPQYITESKNRKEDKYVAVIPLPYSSGKLRDVVRKFVKNING